MKTLLRICHLLLRVGCSALLATSIGSCQGYEFVYQPQSDREASRLHFTVASPAEADILFVIDNSSSMEDEQDRLLAAFNSFLATLAPQDTRYRIGIVATDSYGFSDDCSTPPQTINEGFDPLGFGGKGNCTRTGVVLRRPHDGVRGRLIAAYDGDEWMSARGTLTTSEQQTAFDFARPDDARTGGVVTEDGNGLAVDGGTGTLNSTLGERWTKPGIRWVIDREHIQTEACIACNCDSCDEANACRQTCANPVAEALVKGHFRSNLRGLGVDGFGWEEGIKSGLLAVGVDPEQTTDAAALSPAYNLLAAGQPNSILVKEKTGEDEFPTCALSTVTNQTECEAINGCFWDASLDGGTCLLQQGWVRSGALLAILFLSDEQDCSMPKALLEARHQFETSGNPVLPGGSICYQQDVAGDLLSVSRMADLLVQRKSNAAARVAVGFIGGVMKTGEGMLASRSGAADDCITEASVAPAAECSCLAEQPLNDFWCLFSENMTGGTGSSVPRCNALAGSRYVTFANAFERRTFESVCRTDTDASNNLISFGPVLQDFATIATLSCFALDVRPARDDPDLITVRRRSRDDDVSTPLVELSVRDSTSIEEGWYYDAAENKVCLTGLDRLVGDAYEIFVLHTDAVDFTE